jgi:arylsulfatase A-like enzyme
MPARPNILLIVFDTARADAFEPYGAAGGSSPAFADLARRGIAHQAMHANACWTVPSHAALFTGLLPRRSGLIRAPGGAPRGCRSVLEAQRERLLPEVLRRSGYATEGISTNLWITENSGFDLGFDRFTTVDTRRQAEMTHTDTRSRLRWLAEGVRARVDDGAAEAEAALRRMIDERADEPDPFFCFVNLVEVHSPYLPPRPYNDLGPVERARAAVEARRHLTMGEIWRACAGGFDVPDAALERMRHLYAAATRLLDDWLGRVLEYLDRAGALDDTLVIVTSDHGENFGESGLMGHAYSLDQRLTRLPFAAAGPVLPDASGVASLASLPALVADAVGIERHPYGQAAGEPAVAVSEFDPPVDDASDPRVEKALERWGLGSEAAERITTPLTAATDGRWKLLARGEQRVLFDLESDPLESEPLDPGGAEGAAPVTELAAALEAASGEQATSPAPGAGAEAAAEISDEERAKLEERMRLLGYM